MDKQPLKERYNFVLKRHKKACKYLDSKNVPQKWIDEYKRVVEELNILLNEIGGYTEYEVLEGFNIKGGINNE